MSAKGFVGLGAGLLLAGVAWAGCAGESESDGPSGPAASAPAAGSTAGSGGGSTAASSGNGGSGGSGECAPLPQPCAECAFDACNAQYCECFDNADCQGQALCISLCDPEDTDCLLECWADYPDGTTTLLLLGDCAAQPCEDECAGAIELSDCQLCMMNDCSAEVNACYAIGDCFTALSCAQACPQDENYIECIDDCLVATPTQEGNDLFECAAASCDTECGLDMP
jgi:hypothetical protein